MKAKESVIPGNEYWRKAIISWQKHLFSEKRQMRINLCWISHPCERLRKVWYRKLMGMLVKKGRHKTWQLRIINLMTCLYMPKIHTEHFPMALTTNIIIDASIHVVPHLFQPFVFCIVRGYFASYFCSKSKFCQA